MSIFKRKEGEPGLTTPETAVYKDRHTLRNGITASAVPINLKNAKEVEAVAKRQKANTWQSEAFDYYKYIGEVHYSASLIAEVLSRINIYVGYVTDPSLAPSPIGSLTKDDIDEQLQSDAESAVRLLDTSPGGLSGLLRSLALNLFITGECFLVQEQETFYRPERWSVRSVHEMVVNKSTNSFQIKENPDDKATDLKDIPPTSYVARLWRNDPQYSGQADSSMRAVLDTCEQLLLISRQERVASRSSLNNGILFIPEEITNLYQNDGDMDPDDPELAELANTMPSLEEDIMAHVQASIEDEMSGSSVAPYILRGPAEYGTAIQHITLQRELDSTTSDKTNALIDRILAGLAIPKDIAAGMSGTKYSTAAIIEQTLYSSHIEPMALLIADELTQGFLYPVLKSMGYETSEIRDVVIWYDPSSITSKPSKSEAATVGYQIKAISKEAWRRENGFVSSDAPSEMEAVLRMMEEKGLISEAVMNRMLALSYPSVMSGLRDEQLGAMDPQSAEALEQALGAPPAQAPPAPPEDATDNTTPLNSDEASGAYTSES